MELFLAREKKMKQGVAVAIDSEVPEGALDSAAEAMDGCPVGAIEEE